MRQSSLVEIHLEPPGIFHTFISCYADYQKRKWEREEKRERRRNGKRNHCRIFYLGVLIITKLSSLNTYVHPIYQTYHIIQKQKQGPRIHGL